MKVVLITPRGFCPGVVNAMKIVRETINDINTPKPITILGMIVHNQFVVDDFSLEGVITIDNPKLTRLELAQQIKEGTVIITAHGVSDHVFEYLNNRGIHVVDATCKDVKKTRDLIKDYLKLDYEILYIGKRNHPESEGVCGLSSNIHLCETIDDLHHIHFKSNKLFVTNQTTFSVKDVEEFLTEIKIKYPNAIISDEICSSTRLRQEAIIQFNQNVDVCFIVGDKRSNNTKNLAKISQEVTHTQTYLIESKDDITKEMLQGCETVSVSSGASTPTRITREVIEFLKSI